MPTLWSRLAALFRFRRLERELDDEIASHLAMQEEEFRLQGMDPASARLAAQREFGGVARTREIYRERRGLPWIETTLRDLRYALRTLRRNPGFTAAAILSLALGIGANTAIFSLVHALILRHLPVARPAELVSLYRTGGWGRGISSWRLYQDIAPRSDLFNGVFARSAVDKVAFHATTGDRPETVRREFVSANYFSALGIAPAAGRFFTPADDAAPHACPFAILSYDFWQRRFAANPAVLGSIVIVDAQPLTVIGIAARGFHGVEVDHRPDLWVPAAMHAGDIQEPGMYWLWIMARLQPAVSRSQAQAAVDVLLRRHLAATYGSHPNAAFQKTALSQQIEVRPAAAGLSSLRDQFSEPLLILMAAVGLVLVATSLNVANLMLARAAARRKEIALRLSLGASRGRLLRQSLTETLLLAGAGSVAGVLFALWAQAMLLRFLPPGTADSWTAAPEPAVLLFTIGVSLLSAVLFGVAPAFRAAAVDPAACIKSGSGASGPRSGAWRRSLVVAQVAFSVILVVLAGLFGHSLVTLRSRDLGFRNQAVTSFSLDLPRNWTSAQTVAARDRVVTELESLPGVSLVSYGSPGPYLDGMSNRSLRLPGSELTVQPVWINVHQVAPGYFDILGSTILAGRAILPADGAPSARKVALVNQAFVRQMLNGDPHPLDRPLDFEDRDGSLTYIVGVVPDIAHFGLRQKAVPTVYLPAARMNAWWGVILVRSSLRPGDLAAAIRARVASLGPEIAASEPRTLERRIDDSIFQDRLLASVGGFFGALALMLAGVGLYGVVSYGMARRAREIGIRIALGASRPKVLWMAVHEALVLVALGLILGLPAALAAARTLQRILFDVRPADPAAFGATAAALLLVSLAAAFLPARRAASIQPVHVLRQD